MYLYFYLAVFGIISLTFAISIIIYLGAGLFGFIMCGTL